MKTIVHVTDRPPITQSTLLIGKEYIDKYLAPLGLLKGNEFRELFRRIVRDPLASEKLSLLKSDRWKKIYQSGGQDLQKVYFYPDQEDWARLSLFSNATGYSRCFIFIYLLKFYLNIYKLIYNGTQKNFTSMDNNLPLTTILKLTQKPEKLWRILKPPQKNH